MELRLFDYLDSFNDKERIEVNDKIYNKFVLNRSLSYFPDTVAIVNEINVYPDIPNQQHYDFIYYMVSKRRRFKKWHKPETVEYIREYAEFKGINIKVAKEHWNIFSDEQKEEIINLLVSGKDNEHARKAIK
jgi:hypothetical protein